MVYNLTDQICFNNFQSVYVKQCWVIKYWERIICLGGKWNEIHKDKTFDMRV